jgi:acetyltransferase-like isoleucine patch superfamily enzyme
MNARSMFRAAKLYLSRLEKDLRSAAKVADIQSANPKVHVDPALRVLGTPTQLTVGEGSLLEEGVILDFRQGGTLILGRNVTVRSGAILAPFGGFIRIGDQSGVNHYTVLYGHGGLTIGSCVRFAAHCLVVPANHGIATLDVPIFAQSLSKKGIVIGDDVWIGAHCTILDGVSIGDGSVIAAGSVVNKTVERRTVAAGVPAKAIRGR